MQRRDWRDDVPHTIVIHSIDPDSGEIEWEIHHPDGCPTESWDQDLDDRREPMEYYVCSVEMILDGMGIQEALEDDLKVGTLAVIAHGIYDDYTHESDAWLEVVDDA